VSDSAFTILIPVYNDWLAASILVGNLDKTAARHGFEPDVVLVNDGSTTDLPADFLRQPPRALRNIEIVHLRENLGHQRALCIGLVYVYDHRQGTPVLVMDADGEDAPEDIPALWAGFHKYGGRKVVFAARAKRAEGPIFKLFYAFFQLVHWFLVGFGTRMGNFSIVPPNALARLVVMPEIWNHYAASVIKSRTPFTSIPVDRAKRIAGRSKMGLVALILHGLSAISVYGGTVGVRMLLASSAGAVVSIFALLGLFALHVSSPATVPVWAIYAGGLIVTLMFQAVMISLIYTFLILYGRSHPAFVPARDCPVYIAAVERVHSSESLRIAGAGPS